MGHDELSFVHRLGRTMGVLFLLILAAAGVSYLWAYGVSDAMIAGNLKDLSTSDADQRPREMELVFALILGFFLAVAVGLRWISERQLRRIDAMGE